MSKATYLLGAGASYGTRGKLPLYMQPFVSTDEEKPKEGILRGLPILQEFPSAIEQLEYHLNVDKDTIFEKKYLYQNALSHLLNVSRAYPTIDTYAKLLYTTKQNDEYIKFKNQLSLFFLIWQNIYKQDLRYDSFTSSLIDAETCQMPELTILSWNYDSQMEMAYQGYILNNPSLRKIWDVLNVYCKTHSHSYFESTKPFAFIKLNGTATFHSTEINQWTLRHDIKDDFMFQTNEKLFWESIYELYDKLNSNPVKYGNELSYAWEHDGEEYLLQTISERVEDTEVLVVIGYSFPYVNRKTDRHIFNSMKSLKTIYIQDTNANAIKDRITAIFEFLQKPLPKIHIHKDIGQFIIPNELG